MFVTDKCKIDFPHINPAQVSHYEEIKKFRALHIFEIKMKSKRIPVITPFVM